MELPIDLADLQAVLRRHGVRFALLFGSRAEGTAQDDPDVDLAVWGGVPASNADAFRLLGQAGVLSDDVADAMAGAAGFRNVLVHDYADVDDVRVLENVDNLDHLRSFVAAMTRVLEAPPA